MEQWEVVGTQYLNFNSQTNNQHIEGVKLHCINALNPHVKGKAVDTFFCPPTQPAYNDLLKADVPFVVGIEFNRHGKPSSYEIIQKKDK